MIYFLGFFISNFVWSMPGIKQAVRLSQASIGGVYRHNFAPDSKKFFDEHWFFKLPTVASLQSEYAVMMEKRKRPTSSSGRRVLIWGLSITKKVVIGSPISLISLFHTFTMLTYHPYKLIKRNAHF